MYSKFQSARLWFVEGDGEGNFLVKILLVVALLILCF